jgi:hypothetical protein
MKKYPFFASVILLLPVAAFAQAPTRTDVGTQEGVEIALAFNGQNTVSERAITSSTTVGTNASATGTLEREEYAATSTRSASEGERHQSAVAAFVRSLLSDADRDAGIGAEVRAVARSQNDSASTTAFMIAKIESRGSFATFFLGSDWGNLGTLRSELVKDAADIARLKTAMGSTTDSAVRADLQIQIDAMQAEQTNIQQFIDARENAFSLFGWATKLFS